MHTDIHSLIREQQVWHGDSGERSPRKEFTRGNDAVSTGIAEADAALPDGGLTRGALHEWSLDLNLPDDKKWKWHPPLSVLSHAIGCSLSEERAAGAPLIAWLNCGPTPQLLEATMPKLTGWHWQPNNVFFAARSDKERLWTALQVLQNRSVFATVVDAKKFDFVATRRLQLAAAASGAVAFLVRPPHEQVAASAAQTRWLVQPVASESAPAWKITLTHARRVVTPQSWVAQWQRTGNFSKAQLQHQEVAEKQTEQVMPGAAAL